MAVDRLAIIDLFGVYAQAYNAGKPGEFLSAFTDTVELAYAQAAEARVAAHPVWARRAPAVGGCPPGAGSEVRSDRVGDRVGRRWLFAGRNVVILTTWWA
jgi:hypothetical protein